MAEVYRVDEKEIDFLWMFAGIGELEAFEEFCEIEDFQTAMEVKNSLLKKKYLFINGKKKYVLADTLDLILSVVRQHDAFFLMEKENEGRTVQKMALFFYQDAIVLIGRAKNEYELIWIPFLPLAMGAIANEISVFRNEVTVAIGSFDEEEAKKRTIEYRREMEAEWICSGQDYGVPESRFKAKIFELPQSQIMFVWQDDGITAIRPDKADLINTLTKWIAKAHGRAIRRSGGD